MTSTGPTRTGALSDAHPVELLITAGLAVAATVAGFGWLVAHTAAGLAGHPIAVSLSVAMHGLADWRHHLANPRLAFPRPARSGLPGPFGMYGAAAIVIVTLSAVALLAARLLRRWRVGGSRGYASAGDVRRALSETAA